MPTWRERLGGWIGGVKRDTFFGVEKPTTGRRAMLPDWYFYAPYGQPRGVDISNIRNLAGSAFIQLCVNTIADEFSQAPWNIVPIDKDAYDESHVEILTEFFLKPNQNKETLTDIRRQWARDILTIDAAVIYKVFDEASYEGSYDAGTKSYVKKQTQIDMTKHIYYKQGSKRGQHKRDEIVKYTWSPLKPQYSEAGKFTGARTLQEIYCRDGSIFLADGDYTGYIHRWIQYSPKLPFREPMIFDRDEIVYTMKNPRSHSFYGYSPIQALEDIIRTLKAQVLQQQGLLKEKAVPEGILSFIDAGPAEMKRLKEYWSKELAGKQHKIAVIGREGKWTPIQITSRDMEMLQWQRWFMKLVLAVFDLNIPVISLQGTAPRAGTEALVKRERRKAVLPLLALFEEEINNNILPEFGFDDVEFKFDTFDLTEALREREMFYGDIDSGLRTVNEIRAEMGLDDVAWGNEPKQQAMSPIPFSQQTSLLDRGTEKLSLDEFKKKMKEG